MIDSAKQVALFRHVQAFLWLCLCSSLPLGLAQAQTQADISLEEITPSDPQEGDVTLDQEAALQPQEDSEDPEEEDPEEEDDDYEKIYLGLGLAIGALGLAWAGKAAWESDTCAASLRKIEQLGQEELLNRIVKSFFIAPNSDSYASHLAHVPEVDLAKGREKFLAGKPFFKGRKKHAAFLHLAQAYGENADTQQARLVELLGQVGYARHQVGHAQAQQLWERPLRVDGDSFSLDSYASEKRGGFAYASGEEKLFASLNFANRACLHAHHSDGAAAQDELQALGNVLLSMKGVEIKLLSNSLDDYLLEGGRAAWLTGTLCAGRCALYGNAFRGASQEEVLRHTHLFDPLLTDRRILVVAAPNHHKSRGAEEREEIMPEKELFALFWEVYAAFELMALQAKKKDLDQVVFETGNLGAGVFCYPYEVSYAVQLLASVLIEQEHEVKLHGWYYPYEQEGHHAFAWVFETLQAICRAHPQQSPQSLMALLREQMQSHNHDFYFSNRKLRNKVWGKPPQYI